MSYNTYLYFLPMSEIHMIMHLARDKSVRALLYRFVKQEIARSAAYGDTPHRTFQQLVAHGTVHTKLFFHIPHEVRSTQRFGQPA